MMESLSISLSYGQTHNEKMNFARKLRFAERTGLKLAGAHLSQLFRRRCIL